MTAEPSHSILQQRILREKIEIKMIMLTHKGRIHYPLDFLFEELIFLDQTRDLSCAYRGM